MLIALMQCSGENKNHKSRIKTSYTRLMLRSSVLHRINDIDNAQRKKKPSRTRTVTSVPNVLALSDFRHVPAFIITPNSTRPTGFYCPSYTVLRVFIILHTDRNVRGITANSNNDIILGTRSRHVRLLETKYNDACVKDEKYKNYTRS